MPLLETGSRWRVLAGAVDPAHLASNVAAAELAVPAEVADELASLAEKLFHDVQSLLAQTGGTRK